MGDRNRLFISYSHEDTKWLEAIKEQLAVLEAEGLVSMCEDTQLKVGEDWYQQLNEMMLSARLGLLLISAPFLTSKFVREQEIPRLFDQRLCRPAKGMCGRGITVGIFHNLGHPGNHLLPDSGGGGIVEVHFFHGKQI